MPLTWTRAGRAELLRRVADEPLTYPEVGATAREERPDGYAHLRRARDIGQGRVDFERAGDLLLRWQVQARAGLGVVATSARVEEGAVVVTTLGRPVGMSAPCRVVSVTRTPDVVAFSYGTLPGHPETGEEAFEVRLQHGGRVRLEVRSFSRPATPLLRAAGPLVGLVASRTVDAYLHALDR